MKPTTQKVKKYQKCSFFFFLFQIKHYPSLIIASSKCKSGQNINIVENLMADQRIIKVNKDDNKGVFAHQIEFYTLHFVKHRINNQKSLGLSMFQKLRRVEKFIHPHHEIDN